MTIQELVEAVYLSTNKENRGDFSKTFVLRRINQLIRKILERGQCWIAYDSTGVEITTGQQSIALPTNMIGDQLISFEFRESGSDNTLVELVKIDYDEIFAATAESGVPKYYALFNKTFYINSLADQDYKVYCKYYRTLASDLALTDVLETVVPPLRPELHLDIETFLITTMNVNSMDLRILMHDFIDNVLMVALNNDYISDTNIKSRFNGILEY